MTNTIISAENLGPIAALEFALTSPGVTVLVAPNGSGKTILLEAVQAAARGEGKLPLRDRTKRGRVEAFGATITIGGTCRHTGAFEVTNLEGRFDLAGLVDPRIKSPALADKARIKALVSLTGVEASVNMFRSHAAFDDFGIVVKSPSLETDDLVEMAAKIKDDYDHAALTQERYAERESGQALALVPPADLDMTSESDPKRLQGMYDDARDALTRIMSRAETAKRDLSRSTEAKSLLETLAEDELTAERNTLEAWIVSGVEETGANLQTIEELRRKAMLLKARNDEISQGTTEANCKIAGIVRQLALVAQAAEIVSQSVTESPTDEQTANAQQSLTDATQSVEQGTLIRSALKDAEKSAGHRKAASLATDKAAKYRDAGKATDEVLSASIKCPQLRIESDGKAARLVTETTRGKSIPYHDLSDGEKWTIAIDIGADQVGAGGLLVISQVGWEGIDGANRHAIHAHAIRRGVYILTAEASSDPDAKQEIQPTLFDSTDAIPVTRTAAIITPEPAKSPAAKRAPKPVATVEEFEDIPF